MWWASAVEAPPSTSPRIVAPRASAIDHSSSTSTPAPSDITKPSRRTSKGREWPVDDRAVMFAEAGHPGLGHGGLGAAGEHGVAPAVADEPGGVGDGVGAGGARGGHALARALEAVAHRDRRRRGVAHHHRDQERRHPPRALLVADVALLLDRDQAADAGADQDADAHRVRGEPARLLEGLRRRPRRRTAGTDRPAGPPWGCRRRARVEVVRRAGSAPRAARAAARPRRRPSRSRTTPPPRRR